MEKEDIQKLQVSVDLIATTTLTILGKLDSVEGRLDTMEKNMVTKKDLALAEFHLQSQISGIETDLKSFKQEVRN